MSTSLQTHPAAAATIAVPARPRRGRPRRWDFASPLEALPPGLPEDLVRKIFLDNARATYRRLPVPVG